jgi:peptidoglycan hydrolase-like protein with peptidoglycan-binding domain
VSQAIIRLLLRRPADTIGVVLVLAISTAILVNALQLQKGPHPAPLLPRSVLAPPKEPARPVAPAPRAAAPDTGRDVTASLPARSGVAILTDIQTELARRGFYAGTVDGVYGPRMDVAIRDFEQAAGLPRGAEPDEALLAAIQRSTVRRGPAPGAQRTDGRKGASTRVVAVQRALTHAGYGKLKPTGVVDEPTRAAILKLERARKLPVKGEPSERVVRELAAITGRPL